MTDIDVKFNEEVKLYNSERNAILDELNKQTVMFNVYQLYVNNKIIIDKLEFYDKIHKYYPVRSTNTNDNIEYNRLKEELDNNTQYRDFYKIYTSKKEMFDKIDILAYDYNQESSINPEI